MSDTRPPTQRQQITTARYQHAAAADKIAVRIQNCAGAVRADLAAGRPAGAAARQIAGDATDLLVALAKAGVLDEVASLLYRGQRAAA
jgi:hypothetical protein